MVIYIFRKIIIHLCLSLFSLFFLYFLSFFPFLSLSLKVFEIYAFSFGGNLYFPLNKFYYRYYIINEMRKDFYLI